MVKVVLDGDGETSAHKSYKPGDLKVVVLSAEEAEAEFGDAFGAGLVAAVDPRAAPGKLGSAASMVFRVEALEADPLAHVPSRVSVLRLEHVSPLTGESLFLRASGGPKPRLASAAAAAGFSAAVASATSSFSPSASAATAMATAAAPAPVKARGLRIVFGPVSRNQDALSLEPLPPTEAAAIARCVGRVPLLRLYAHVVSGSPDWGAALALAEAVAASCAAIVTDLTHLRSRHGDGGSGGGSSSSAAELIKVQDLEQFTARAPKVRDPDPAAQRLAVEVNLLDALFAAALAPYNRSFQRKPFGDHVASGVPRAVQMCLYSAAAAVVSGCGHAQRYVGRQASRLWVMPLPDSISGISGGSGGGSSTAQPAPPASPAAAGGSTAHRREERWVNILVLQSEESLGASALLTDLVRAAKVFASRADADVFLQLVKQLVTGVGPQPRLLGLLSALCFEEGSASRANQEACVRGLWLHPADRYLFGITFHACDHLPDAVAEVDRLGQPPRTRHGLPLDKQPPAVARGSARFVGDDGPANSYGPVCAAWRSPPAGEEWGEDSDALWWAPEKLGVGERVGHLDVADLGPSPALPTPAARPSREDGDLGLVLVEHLLWPLEPERLCPLVFGVPFDKNLLDTDSSSSSSSFVSQAKPRASKSSSDRGRSSSVLMREAREGERRRFKAHKVLAEYAVAELELLADVCRGRSALSIVHLSASFPFVMLLNMAANALLPRRARAASLGLVQALYLDRFPQLPRGGAPYLPESLWVLREEPYRGPLDIYYRCVVSKWGDLLYVSR